jgi:hypothetical protein
MQGDGGERRRAAIAFIGLPDNDETAPQQL